MCLAFLLPEEKGFPFRKHTLCLQRGNIVRGKRTERGKQTSKRQVTIAVGRPREALSVMGRDEAGRELRSSVTCSWFCT